MDLAVVALRAVCNRATVCNRWRPSRPSGLSERGLTYTAVGATLHASAEHERQPGYRRYDRSVCLGHGPAHWEFASRSVLEWGIKTRSGFSVETESGVTALRVTPGRNYWLIAQVGPARVREPVRVVDVVDEPDRKGFAYGTLRGHPVSGEEAFLVAQHDDGSVWLNVRSLTRSSAGPWRIAFPVLVLAQHVYHRRYLRALSA